MPLLDRTTPAPSTTLPAQPTQPTSYDASRQPSLGGRWPLAALLAGPAIFAFPMVGSRWFTEEEAARGTAFLYDEIDGLGAMTHVSMVLAFVGALALAVFAGGFGRFLAARTPAASGLGSLVRLGLGGAVTLAFLVAILKAVYRGGLPDHGDSGMYTPDSVVTLHIILDQLQYTALWPLTLVMAAVAVLAFRDKALPKWYGGFTGLVLAATLAMALGLGLPYFAGLAGPVWLVASAVVVLRHRNRPVAVGAAA